MLACSQQSARNTCLIYEQLIFCISWWGWLIRNFNCVSLTRLTGGTWGFHPDCFKDDTRSCGENTMTSIQSWNKNKNTDSGRQNCESSVVSLQRFFGWDVKCFRKKESSDWKLVKELVFSLFGNNCGWRRSPCCLRFLDVSVYLCVCACVSYLNWPHSSDSGLNDIILLQLLLAAVDGWKPSEKENKKPPDIKER